MADDAYIHTINWRDTKPPLGSELDRSHPLSRGLVGCWLMNEGGGNVVKNLAYYSNIQGTITGAKYKSSTKGMCLDFNKDNRDYVSSITNLNSPPKLSLVVSFEVDSYDSTRSELVSLNDSFGIFLDNLTRATYQYNSSSWQTISFDTNLAGTGNNVIAFTFQTNYQKIYLQGKLKNSATQNHSIYYNSPNLLFGRHPSNAACDFDGRIYYVYFYNRVLSPQEIQSLYIAPYQFIQPITRRFFSSGATSAPGVTTIYRPNHLTMMGVG